MTNAALKLVTPPNYVALDTSSVITYVAGIKSLSAILGGSQKDWTSREVGDGNLNLVFIIEGSTGALVVKQALPYVRLVGESWPLPLSRAHFEYQALVEQSFHAAAIVPKLYHHDHDMALTVMEYLSPHIILRKGLIAGTLYPNMARDLGIFLARTLFFTSDLYLNPVQKREKISSYLTNTAMCKISEDLIFDEPYYNAPLNKHTSPQLDGFAAKIRADLPLKLAVQELKHKFMNAPEALLHGDLHTGSVMVTADDTRVIDPEFAFFGPMGFDIGAILANLFMAIFSQDGHKNDKAYKDWLNQQPQILWDEFVSQFSALWETRTSGEIYNTRLYEDSPALKVQALQMRLDTIWQDALGFAGCKIIRRILGLAHVEDFESIENPDIRAACEEKALIFARRLITERHAFADIKTVLKIIP
jgi:5-methylthioribose kinase